jgi:L-sorbose 1-phosphate reductase
MKTKAVRLYGKDDLRLEEFELPEMGENEILAEVYTDSICMSSYKATKQAQDHKRVPNDIADNPIIIGHEFCGKILDVGSKWKDKFSAGNRFSIQPALNHKGSLDAPGYSFQYIGGDATKIIIPDVVMTEDCLLEYKGEGYFQASLSEPMSCIAGAFHASYHTVQGTYEHQMGIVEGGKMAVLAGVGPMGLGSIDYALNCDRKPGLLVVTDIDSSRLERAAALFSPEEAKSKGVELIYVNTMDMKDPIEELKKLSGGEGFDDVLVMAPVKPVVEQADKILGKDGCLNFFAGPTDTEFSATFNFYNVHYAATHVVGTSGGNTDDMREVLEMMSKGLIKPAVMITHIGGLDAAIETTKNLPNIAGGKKLLYNQIEMDLTAIDDFAKLGESNPLFKNLAEITVRHNGLWSVEAENYLLENK